MKRRTTGVIALVASAALLAGAVLAVLKVQRDREWAHGGNALEVNVELRLATRETLNPTLAALGAPPDVKAGMLPTEQAAVARVAWNNSPHHDGRFLLIALDKRVEPARLFPANQVSKGPGSNGWAGRYGTLAEHYSWLAGTSAHDVDHLDPSRPVGSAVGLPAAPAGSFTAWFTVSGSHPQYLTDPTREVVLAIFYVNERGDVRWAKRIFG